MVTFPQGFGFVGNPRWILLIPTRDAGRLGTYSNRANHSLKREVTKRVGFDELTNLINLHLCSYQVRLVWGIDSVIARTNRRRAANA
jgi:hypothetical protein